MSHRLAHIGLAAAAAISSIGYARAELITLPEGPFTVADCRPGDEWRLAPNGIMRCFPKPVPPPPDNCGNHGLYATNQGGGSTWVPGVGTCYTAYIPPPPPPACYYSGNQYISIVGWASDFSSEPASVTVRYAWGGDQIVIATIAGRADWPNYPQLSPGGSMYNAMVSVMAARGFRPGAVATQWGAWNDGGPYASAWGGVTYQICPN